MTRSRSKLEETTADESKEVGAKPKKAGGTVKGKEADKRDSDSEFEAEMEGYQEVLERHLPDSAKLGSNGRKIIGCNKHLLVCSFR